MNEESLRTLLGSLSQGRVTVDEVVTRLRSLPFEDLGFAHRWIPVTVLRIGQ